MTTIWMTAMLKRFAEFETIGGDQGQLKWTIMGPVRVYMQQDWSNYSPWPTSSPRQLLFVTVADV
jgi:hypothetical protein